MSDISKNILEQIKEDGIKPKPRWQFVLANIFLFLVLIVCVALGGVVMSLVFLKLFNLDWDLLSLAGERGLPPILEVLPMLWIGLLAVVSFLSVWVFERTDKAYKYHPSMIVISSIFISMILGGLLYSACVNGSCFAERFDNLLRNILPQYEALEQSHEEVFFHPEKGLLPAHIIEIFSPDNMHVEDLRGQEWSVELVPNLAERRNVMELREGQLITLLGEIRGEGQFMAYELRAKRGGPIGLKLLRGRRNQ